MAHVPDVAGQRGAHREVGDVDERAVERRELRRVVAHDHRLHAAAVHEARHLDGALRGSASISPPFATLP